MIIEDLRAFSIKEERAFFPIKEEDGDSFGSGDRNGGEMRVNAHEWAALMRCVFVWRACVYVKGTRA